MLKTLGIQSKKELLENKGILSFSLFTTRGHSISNFFLLAWNINNLLIYKYHSGISLLLVFNYFWKTITANNMLLWTILLIIFVLVGYFVLFPIANAGVLHMVANKAKKGEATGKGLTDFYSFFEYSALATSFSLITYLITVMRLFTLDVVDNYFIIGIMIVWGIVVLVSIFLRPFAKIFIAVEGYGVYPAIKQSGALALGNFPLICKATIYQAIVTIYLYFRAGILYLVPLILMYVAIYFGWFGNGIISTMIWILGIIGVFLLGYISAIIYAYFEIYRYKIYQHIQKKQQKPEKKQK